MKFLKDWEYFHDMDENAEIDDNIRALYYVRGAYAKFSTTIAIARSELVQFEARSWLAGSPQEAEKQVSKILNNQIRKKEKDVWQNCVSSFMQQDPKWIGGFPNEKYHLYTLGSAEKPEETYEVEIHCTDMIQKHQVSALRMLHADQVGITKMDRNRRNLRMAALLSVIVFVLNAATTLSLVPGYAFLYFGFADPECWACLVAVILMVARICHRSRRTLPGAGILLMALTASMHMLPSQIGSTEPPLDVLLLDLTIGGVMTLNSLVCCIRYIKDACKELPSDEYWREWILRMDAAAISIHKEIRFLMLWYRHMTGKQCRNLVKQERLLYKCVACADRKRRKYS